MVRSVALDSIPRWQAQAATEGGKDLGTRRDWQYTRVPIELTDQYLDHLSSITVPAPSMIG